LYLIEFGFSITDIEKLKYEYDIREYNQILVELAKREKKDKDIELMKMLSNSAYLGDAFRAALASVFGKKGNRVYSRWKGRIVNRIIKLLGEEQVTVWDKKPRKSKKI
jgi:hypothetical protein